MEESELKVEDWLSKQPDSGTFNLVGKHQSLQLVKTWVLDHVKTDNKIKASNRFTVSESGAVGISCAESPSLSVMYPGTDKSPTVLSEEKNIYRSATFVKISSIEYLAAANLQDGCLYLWDIESKTSKKVFDPKFPNKRDRRFMNIFKISENKVGYGQADAVSDRSRKVFILEMDNGECGLIETLSLFTTHSIRDMSHIIAPDGTSSLLLCVPSAHHITAVEMIGGRTRWEVGKQQMGEEFFPWSICTDQTNCAYVADFGQRMVHLLSATDGTIIKCFHLDAYDIKDIFTIRIYDQHLYLEHVIVKEKPKKYAITKFKQIKIY